jgi:ferrous iron transport protein B
MAFGPKADILLLSQNRLDHFLLSGFWGGVAFFAIMTFLFQAIFTWASPLMDFVESGVSKVGAGVAVLLPSGIIADFVNDAVFGGFGSFLVFVPQIFMLTFIIGVLEDSGYLARAAIICHRPLSFFGLSGRSFVPLLSGHACAIPAVFAARTIESPKHRLMTIIAIPLMSCSARLPVYALFISILIPPTTYLGGFIGLRGLSFFALYLMGIILALLVTAMISRTVKRNESSAPFIIELPPYRIPSWRPLLQRSFNYSWSFITRAGGVIFTVTLVVWVLGYFPNGSGHLESSWLALLGKWLDPLTAPLGIDWKFGVAILASFVAREVFVGTLGTLFGIEGGEDRIADVAGQIHSSGLSIASGFALLVFYVVSLQCASTLAVIRKEVGSARLPLLLFFGYGILAYVLAIATRYLVSALMV